MPVPVILIAYTTRYREGGDKFQRAAEVMARELREAKPLAQVICQATESKKSFANLVLRVAKAGQTISELHFIGHSGVYGIMFGTRRWPEQFSPHEWSQLRIPFAPDAQAWFHACRTGRWFAPFFTRTFGIRSHGHHWYTTVSLQKDRFVKVPATAKKAPIYIISCRGRTSHGLLISASKYLGRERAIPMTTFTPENDAVDRSYDLVAADYAATFPDITVRRDEIRWLNNSVKFSQNLRVLDIGCGNGALLAYLAPRIAEGVGVDASTGMIAEATKNAASLGLSNLTFAKIAEPALPFADDSFDVVISLLSFRYLDWDPIVREIQRVLKRGGQFIVIDMVTKPVAWWEIPAFGRDKMKAIWQRYRNPDYHSHLQKMVHSEAWQNMLKQNPIRSEHEMRWYLESRFPGAKLKIINRGYAARIGAFCSPAVDKSSLPPLTYP